MPLRDRSGNLKRLYLSSTRPYIDMELNPVITISTIFEVHDEARLLLRKHLLWFTWLKGFIPLGTCTSQYLTAKIGSKQST
jgi:hypothetical protein